MTKSHIPSLDGIRGIAALLVFIAHAGLGDLIPGGLGVTIFFFLSGYLITTLLCNEYQKHGSISLKNFYLRRVFRIFPPLYLTLALALIIALVTHQHVDASAFFLQLAQLTNYYLLLGKGDLAPYTGPMWSLSVEEHFYLLFPVTLVFLMRKQFTFRGVAASLAAVCLVVLAWRALIVTQLDLGKDYVLYATDTRIDSIIFGCILALWKNPTTDTSLRPAAAAVWLAAGIAMLLASLAVRNEIFRDTLRYSVQGAALLPVFYCAVRFNRWPIFSWLELRVMRALGLISYTFYLCHLAFLRFADGYIANRLAAAIVALAASIAFAALVYVLIERHTATIRRKLQSYGPPRDNFPETTGKTSNETSELAAAAPTVRG